MTKTRDESATGAAAKAAAPVVFWDGYGLDHAASGVSVHARSLARAWRAPFLPTVVAPPGTKRAGDLGEFPVTELPPSRLGRLKPVWPERVGRFVDKGSLAATFPTIVHGLSNFNLPVLTARPPVRAVLTVHDLIPLLSPGSVSKALALQLRFLMPRALARADRIVCVSRWTQATIGELFPRFLDKCAVLPNGRPELSAPKPARSASGVIQALAVGRSEPYKRLGFLATLLRATKLPLVVTVVTDPAGRATLATAAADLVAAGRLRLLSGVTDAALAGLYAAADVYLQPSTLEGYCLPAVSALAALTPVVYQAGSGIDEVAGDAVAWPLAFDATPATWAEAIAAAASAGRAAAFPARVAADLARLPTWDMVAADLAALYVSLS